MVVNIMVVNNLFDLKSVDRIAPYDSVLVWVLVTSLRLTGLLNGERALSTVFFFL